MPSGLLQDLRYVLRVLGRSRAFTAVAVLSLAIGIGANTAVYSAVRVLLLDPMPVRAPEELALVYWHDGDGELSISQINSSGYEDPDTGRQYRSNLSYPIYAAMRDAGVSGAALAGYNFIRDLSVAFDDRPAMLAGALAADGRYFSVLQPGMALGRPLGDADDRADGPMAVVISHTFWQRAFGGDANVLGRAVRVNGVAATVVGVTADGFRGLSKGGFFPQTEVTVPLRAFEAVMPRLRPDGGSLLTSDRHFWVRVLARVAPDAPRETVVTPRLSAVLQPHVSPLIANAEAPPDVRLLPGERGLDQVRSETRRLLFVLLGVAGVVLLIACVNLAGLMLSRGVARQRELAVRRALGAGRARLVRQLLLEGLCLALAGGAGALILTYWSRHALTTYLTAGLGTAPMSTQPLEVVVDARLAAWTFGVCVTAALACSLLPALRLTRAPAVTQLRHQAAGAPRLLVGRWLLAAQIAVSVPLVVGAALFLQTLANLGRVDLGFDPQGLAFFRLDPVATGAPEDQHADVYRQVLDRIRAVPGVSSVTLMENVFLSGITSNTSVEVGEERLSLYTNAVGPDFTDTLGLRVLAGRVPDAGDGPGRPLVAAINETAARRLFGEAPPLGRTITLGSRQVEVVGLVSDSLYDRQRAAVRPTMFDSALQRPGFGGHNVVVRTATPVGGLEPLLRDAVSGVHPDLPVPEVRTQVAQMQSSIVRERVFAQLLTIFGAFALLLASLGLHGVTAYSVSRRRGEIGVRMALGARPAQVLWLVLRQVVVLAVAGLAVGVPLAMMVAPLLGSLLYGVAPTDALLVSVASLIMLSVAIAAGLVPARRAARIDPLIALRTD